MPHEKPVKRPANAFTLIELLVVIAIIALLVSILMPSLQKAKEMAKDVVCASHQKNVSYAMFLYAQDYNDQIPVNTMYAPGWYWLNWGMRIGRIADSNDTIPIYWLDRPDERRICAEGYVDFHYGNDYSYPNDMSYSTDGTFKCPAYWDQVQPKSRQHHSRHFSIHKGLSPVIGGPGHPLGEPEPEHRCARLADIRGKVALIGDGALKPAAGHWPSVFWQPMGYGLGAKYTEFSLQRSAPWPWQVWGTWASPAPLGFYGHSGERSNLTFIDGHVDMIKDLKPSDFNPD
jgi:prepilin-type N-terminal cleavage/methylation domain-containing protein/prepilin-type processing-associated H-X9-DG protein